MKTPIMIPKVLAALCSLFHELLFGWRTVVDVVPANKQRVGETLKKKREENNKKITQRS